MKKLFALISFIITLSFISFKQDNYTPPQLDWATHYKGKADKNSPFFALTAMTWKYSYNSTASKTKVKIDLTNTLSIDVNRSWVKWDKITEPKIRESLLHHEQGHVNIEYILLKEADRVLKNNEYSVRNYKTEIANLANQLSTYFNTMQLNYDEETEHGSNHKMQARWDVIIADKTREVMALQ
ncbi:DUF922 domain-containing protein [Pedobacter changchengzhani]|nr:DUF922 domain-containing protein [Pedobacter changchengzhani]